MQIEHQTLRLRRLSMHVATAGAGIPVVLLHGWPQTRHVWRKVMPLLAPHYRS
jgi:pimeloyl-ACP methyl ester carboxylesterase